MKALTLMWFTFSVGPFIAAASLVVAYLAWRWLRRGVA